jgi:ABC-type multidrug transport system ATPase subunit
MRQWQWQLTPLHFLIIGPIAGKTTALNLLVGLTRPTHGTVQHAPGGLPATLGLCPQHNVLWARLTVEEHLRFFRRLKGCPGAAGPAEDAAVAAMLADLGMAALRHTLAGVLSGGQQRRLCCAIALIGDPAVVVLDEPTSGQDPAARRATWDLLHKHRANKAIVITTHYMVRGRRPFVRGPLTPAPARRTRRTCWPTASPFCTTAACCAAAQPCFSSGALAMATAWS